MVSSPTLAVPPRCLPGRGPAVEPRRGLARLPGWLAVAFVASCGQTLDAGYNEVGLLPVSAHNPVILLNDTAADNWSGEYAALFAQHGGPHLAGIVVNATPYWPDLDANLAGWSAVVAAARDSHLGGIPDPLRSEAPQLVVPADRLVFSTKPNGSAGAQLILRMANQLSLPGQPLVVLSSAALTDVADAFLLDPTVVDRVVVVAQLGSAAAPGATMGTPNGDLDPWADWIVAQHFTYLQISVSYDQGADVTAYDVDKLPRNALGTWMATKRATLSNAQTSADQGPLLALAAPDFVTTVVRGTADTSAGFNVPRGQGPPLVPNPTGNAWLVTQVDASVARSRLWAVLSSPDTFSP
jgi:hypothetical protein